MDFKGFDPKKMDEYSTQAKALYGKTDAYRDRFLDAYGRDKIDEEKLRIVAAAEVFG